MAQGKMKAYEKAPKNNLRSKVFLEVRAPVPVKVLLGERTAKVGQPHERL